MELPELKHPETGAILPPAKPAGTLILFRDDVAGEGAPKLLILERAATMAFAAGAAVFPGGRVDAADYDFAQKLDTGLDIHDAAARIASIRETLEEAGLAVAIKGPLGFDRVAAARASLHAGEAGLGEICERFDWLPDLAALSPWSRWRPPGHSTRVYDTRFYIADAGAVKKDGWADNTESTSLFWASAQEVLDRSATGELSVVFPTRRNLERLALWQNFADAKAHALEYSAELVLTFMEERDGEKFLCIPEGMGYPVTSEPYATVKRG